MKRIIEILHVVDTRDWEEVADDKWVAIAGSGDARECDRCGKLHEVQATVLLEDKKEIIVGTGCMKKDMDTLIYKRLKSYTNTAKTIARLKGQLEKVYVEYQKIQDIHKEVDSLVTPEIEITEIEGCWDSKKIPVAVMGDSKLWLNNTMYMGKVNSEARYQLISSWRRDQVEKRIKAQINNSKLRSYGKYYVEDLETRLNRAENKLKAIQQNNKKEK